MLAITFLYIAAISIIKRPLKYCAKILRLNLHKICWESENEKKRKKSYSRLYLANIVRALCNKSYVTLTLSF